MKSSAISNEDITVAILHLLHMKVNSIKGGKKISRQEEGREAERKVQEKEWHRQTQSVRQTDRQTDRHKVLIISYW